MKFRSTVPEVAMVRALSAVLDCDVTITIVGGVVTVFADTNRRTEPFHPWPVPKDELPLSMRRRSVSGALPRHLVSEMLTTALVIRAINAGAVPEEVDETQLLLDWDKIDE
ncbi:MAG: hypothetical protein A3J48_01595 [Candidatus Doudnabacteria bacterium RIFCSPHIGHO2_02_FULL_46_11]|uniref:Uncharacterized protein n=1 Tax=Candidatus Doudnabacteria bacterium RIFCSPHIGHO2_02_FULL_46_11 TaxID=1817832 RepID=A0A1F5P9L3_9BACT|nr:MAG: hypothetical protein A3J48_01595 [Candidatus Doudnabacteria bacterium RIFCSPHIGHO2_02_FULL_46_11]